MKQNTISKQEKTIIRHAYAIHRWLDISVLADISEERYVCYYMPSSLKGDKPDGFELGDCLVIDATNGSPRWRALMRALDGRDVRLIID